MYSHMLIFLFSHGFVIDFLEITHRVPKKNYTCIQEKKIVPSRNYSHMHGKVLHAYALQFLVSDNLFPLCITASYYE